MKVVAIAQARMGSTRVPGKVMRKLGGRPVLRWTIDALDSAHGIDRVILATSTLPMDDEIADYACGAGIEYFRGSPEDVLDRFYQCALTHKADIVLRLTCDCPFLDPRVIEEVIRLRQHSDASYASNIDPPSYPDGLDVECFTFAALEAAWNEAVGPVDRDCAPQFIVRNRSRFPAVNLRCPLPALEKERWVLDTEEDWLFCQEIVARLPTDEIPSYLDIMAILDDYPELRNINAKWKRNERFYDGLADEALNPRSFKRSDMALSAATRIIPFGAQTFSKSHIQFPAGRAPLYCTHGDGAYLFDVDGNRYVDLVSAVLPVVLGYRDPDVDQAIREQLDRGISFSLSSTLEAELAEILCRLIPCCQMVKFGKSGTDVTTAAIRLARAHTGREHILLSGYHGWADWSMAPTDRNLGIPLTVQDLSHRFIYGDIERVMTLARIYQPAAVIVEPNDNPHFLKLLRAFTAEKGIVLIFDEIITGFRYAMGGAQEYFGVTPDLATFGKAMANGMPLSAICGSAKIMSLMAPPGNIFYSGTMFGETLSIAAAIATIRKMSDLGDTKPLWEAGKQILSAISEALRAYPLHGALTISGLPPRTILNFNGVPGATADQLRALFMAEMAQNGVLIINSNNVSFSMRAPEIRRIGTAYMQTFGVLHDAILSGNIEKRVGNGIAAAPLRATA